MRENLTATPREPSSLYRASDPLVRIDAVGREQLMDEPDRDRALADGGGDAVHRTVADVSRGEDTGDAGLERERAALERPAAVTLEIRSGRTGKRITAPVLGHRMNRVLGLFEGAITREQNRLGQIETRAVSL